MVFKTDCSSETLGLNEFSLKSTHKMIGNILLACDIFNYM